MASTSPYTPNDYQAVSNYRPYQLPINDIYKAIDAQNRFWQVGAERIKGVYESALNLDLTLDSNIELRKNFMENAQKQLSKLSTMDVSDPSVQRQGFGIFKPLLQDKGIMYDDFITKKYREVVNDADHWKNDEKSKGEGFSMDNLAYALRSFKGFSSNTTRDQLDGIYKTAKNAEYTPYYDVSKERLALLDKCKPDITSGTTIQGMYMETDKRTTLSSQKLWGCLESGLSDKARQQTRISGAVRYGDDYETLKREYVSTAQDKRSYYNEQMKLLSTQKAAFAGKKGYEKYIEGLDEQMDGYKTGMAKLDKDLLEYGTWDDDYMKKNYEDLASMAYFKRANGAFAEAFARKDIEQSVKADPVGMIYYTQKKLDDRQAAGFMHDEAMEDYKMRLKLLSGEGTMDDATRLRLMAKYGVDDATLQSTYGTAVDEPATSYDVLKGSIAIADKNIEAKANEIKQFAEKNPELAKVVGDVTDINAFNNNIGKLEEFVRLRLKTDPNDVEALEMKAGLNSYLQLLNEKTHHQAILEDAQAETTRKNPEIAAKFNQQKSQILSLANKNTVLTDNVDGSKPTYSVDIDGNRAMSIIQGFDPRFKIEKIGSGIANPYTGQTSSGTYYIRDMQTGTLINSPNIDLAGLAMQLDAATTSKQGSYIGKVNEILTQHSAVQKMRFAAGNLLGSGKLDEKMTPAMKFVSSAFGSELGDVKFNTRGGFDPVTGWTDIEAIYDSGKNKGKPVSASDLRTALSNSQFGAGIYDESKYPNAVRLKIPYLTGILESPQYSETVNELINYASQKVTTENIPQGLLLDAGMTPEGNKIQLKTTKSLASGSAKHTILVNGTEIPIKIGNDAASAMNYINKLLTGQELKPIQ